MVLATAQAAVHSLSAVAMNHAVLVLQNKHFQPADTWSQQPAWRKQAVEAVGYIPGALAQISLALAKGVMGSLLLTCCCLHVSLLLL